MEESNRMRILVLGGSWYLGRLIVHDLVGRGHDVTTFNRGRVAGSPKPDDSGSPLPGVRYLFGDRERQDDLRALADCGPWDIAVDISGKVPAVVGAAARSLADVVDRYACVSTVAAYRDWPHAPVTEDSPLLAADAGRGSSTRDWDPETYGPLMADAERICRDVFDADRLLIIRLHLMIGPHEYADPLLWWLDRTRRGGALLLPAPDRRIQPIDVRDAARFLADQVSCGARGAFNVAAPDDGRTYGDLVRACATLATGDTQSNPVWVDEDWLTEQGVQEWTEMPLWRRAPSAWTVGVDRAVAAGLRCRPLVDTVTDTWQWLAGGGVPRRRRRPVQYGMDPAREAALIARWQGTIQNSAAGVAVRPGHDDPTAWV
jgi:2'-hydroxyisoflavone reductase